MKALVWSDINKIEVIEKAKPQILHERDAIVKVTLSSICTSDLHIIKGCVPKALKGTTLGHEFVGEIVELGSKITSLKIGDRVCANCETFCGECFFCKRGYINNCEKGGWKLGCTIDGCQAEYVRVPFADTGLTKIPNNVTNKNALFVGDILSSGFWGAELCEIKKGDTVAVIGCGPVGLCAMQSARIMGAEKIIALDIDDIRLNIARQNNLADVYLKPDNNLNLNADSVIECAGGNDSFKLAWQIARPNAIVVLVAMYESAQTLPLPDMYGKNLTFKTGGVDAIHCKEILELIRIGELNTDFLITEEIPFNNILSGYEKFSKKESNLLKIAIF